MANTPASADHWQVDIGENLLNPVSADRADLAIEELRNMFIQEGACIDIFGDPGEKILRIGIAFAYE